MDEFELEVGGEWKNEKAVSKFTQAMDILWTQPHCAMHFLRGADSIPVDDNAINIVAQHVKVFGVEPDRIRKLVSKSTDRTLLESCSYESTIEVKFLPQIHSENVEGGVGGMRVPYCVKCVMDANRVVVIGKISSNACEKDITLLNTIIVPKIVHLMKTCESHSNEIVRSCRLVNLEQYNSCYRRIKSKHSQHLTQTWTEKTNPEKFIHEDLAIAAYLITYWNKLDVKPTFCDVGCGNGLLVYILTQEGYHGYGLDLRSRVCWQAMFNGTANKYLKVAILDPSEPDFVDKMPLVDWYIGNHSDELTPWIAYLAARRKKNAFIIPCCTWDFFSKYQRFHSAMSAYASYMKYITSVCIGAGLDVTLDRLMIPSLKRACLMAEYKEDCVNSVQREQAIDTVIRMAHSKFKLEVSQVLDSLRVGGKPMPTGIFKPRPVEIVVANCTTVPKTTQMSILKKIVDRMLAQENVIKLSTDVQWNKGGCIRIDNCHQSLNDKERLALKQQGNGLLTLVKNYKHVFCIERNKPDEPPSISLRSQLPPPRKSDATAKNKPCVYQLLHPQGCPFTHNCFYSH